MKNKSYRTPVICSVKTVVSAKKVLEEKIINK
jgi:hypothetical protein